MMTTDIVPGDFVKVRRYLSAAKLTRRDAGCVLAIAPVRAGSDRLRVHLQTSPDDEQGIVFTCWPEEIAHDA